MTVEVADFVLLGCVTFVGCFQLGTFAQRVGNSRRKFKIEPPCMDGDPEFLRTVRAQQNNLEFFPMFTGCLWISGLFFHQVPAAILGVYYLYLREQYFVSYIAEAKARVKPFKKSTQVLRIYAVLCIAGLAQTLVLHYIGFDMKTTLLHYVKGFTGY